MALTGTQVANRVKRQFGDEIGAQIDDTVILDWINDGQREIVARSDELFQTKASANTTSGTAEYTLPTLAANILRLHRVIYKGTRLTPLTLQEAEEIYPHKDDASAYPVGTPCHYWVWADKITLMPAPDTTGSTLTIYFQTYPTDLGAIANALTLPDRYHLRVVDYCIAKAAELDDDDDRHNNKMAVFQADIDSMQQDSYWKNQDIYPFPRVSVEDMSYDGY